MRESHALVRRAGQQCPDQPHDAADHAEYDERCQGLPDIVQDPAPEALDLALEQDWLVAFVQIYMVPDITSPPGVLDGHLKQACASFTR